MPYCDGDSVVSCIRGALQPWGCNIVGFPCTSGQLGKTCTQQLAWDTCGEYEGSFGCTTTGPACDESTFEIGCDGSAIVTCSLGYVGRFDCASLDPSLTCRRAHDGSLTCAASATECDSDIVPADFSEIGATMPETCHDGVITFCYFGHKTKVDCRRFGLSGCTATTGVPSRASCTP